MDAILSAERCYIVAVAAASDVLLSLRADVATLLQYWLTIRYSASVYAIEICCCRDGRQLPH